MARFQKYLLITLSLFIFCLLATGVHADPFVVQSLRVEKAPGNCNTTLYVTIRNNSQTTSNSGLFVQAAQFQDLGNNQKYSSSIGAVRLDNLPPGQSREVSYTFIRERRKTGVSFRFKVVADTLAYTERSLPSVTEQYSGKVQSPVLDRANNRLTGSVVNQGSVAIPKPSIQLYVAPANAPSDFSPGGGGMVTQCLAPGASVSFNRPTPTVAQGSVVKVDLLADGMVLESKILGGSQGGKTFHGIKRAPAKRIYRPKTRVRDRPLIRRDKDD